MSEQAVMRGEAHAEARPTRIMLRCNILSPPLEEYGSCRIIICSPFDFPFLENV